MPLIMVIDDSPTVRKIVEVALNRQGYQVLAFDNGVEALRAMTTGYCPQLDLILLDICMPQMDGYQIARYIRSKSAWRAIPIVGISRLSGCMPQMKARLTGMQALLAKPFTQQQLVSVVSIFMKDLK